MKTTFSSSLYTQPCCVYTWHWAGIFSAKKKISIAHTIVTFLDTLGGLLPCATWWPLDLWSTSASKLLHLLWLPSNSYFPHLHVCIHDINCVTTPVRDGHDRHSMDTCVCSLHTHLGQPGPVSLTCGAEEPGIKPSTLQLVEDPFYFLSHSHPSTVAAEQETCCH